MTLAFRNKYRLRSLNILLILAVFGLGYVCGIFHSSTTLNDLEAAENADDSRATESYVVTTMRQSYFCRDANGGLSLRNGLPFRQEGAYSIERKIEPHQTAVIVMDPWVDMASDHLNQYFGKVAESRVVPLVKKAIERGHPVIVLTNDPKTVKYNTAIHPDLSALVSNGKASLLYHQDLDDDAFATYLQKHR